MSNRFFFEVSDKQATFTHRDAIEKTQVRIKHAMYRNACETTALSSALPPLFLLFCSVSLALRELLLLFCCCNWGPWLLFKLRRPFSFLGCETLSIEVKLAGFKLSFDLTSLRSKAYGS